MMIAQSSSRRLSISNICLNHTLMPFLYRTKTLSPLPDFCYIVRPRQPTPSRCRNSLHTLALSCYRVSASHESDIPIRKVPFGKDVGIVSRLPKRYPGDDLLYKRGVVGRAKTSDDIPWEDKLQSSVSRGKGFNAQSESIPFENTDDIDDVDFTTYAKPFEEENMFEDDIEDTGYPSEPAARPGRDSTITVAERHAFQRIFADILARSKSSTLEVDPDSSKNNVSTKPVPRGNKANDQLDSIMDKAMKTASKTRPLKSLIEKKSQQELRAAVDRYPPALREAAAKAIGLVSERSTNPAQDQDQEIVSVDVDLEHIRGPERERVESLMRAAKTDIELWQVMEQEIFSMVEKLGFGEKRTGQSTSKKPRGRKSKKQDAEAVKATGNLADPSHNNDQARNLTTYGPLYPSHLLLGLRLLDRSFEKPSPLVLNVLPRIKSLGIISHVLGASTALYNELLRIYWFRYDDFPGAHNLLNEMDQAGLEFDAETFSIVNEIHSMQARVRRGDKGPVLQALWAMPEFAPGKFKPWKDRIQAALAERGSEGSDELVWKG